MKAEWRVEVPDEEAIYEETLVGDGVVELGGLIQVTAHGEFHGYTAERAVGSSHDIAMARAMVEAAVLDKKLDLH